MFISLVFLWGMCGTHNNRKCYKRSPLDWHLCRLVIHKYQWHCPPATWLLPLGTEVPGSLILFLPEDILTHLWCHKSVPPSRASCSCPREQFGHRNFLGVCVWLGVSFEGWGIVSEVQNPTYPRSNISEDHGSPRSSQALGRSEFVPEYGVDHWRALNCYMTHVLQPSVLRREEL